MIFLFVLVNIPPRSWRYWVSDQYINNLSTELEKNQAKSIHINHKKYHPKPRPLPLHCMLFPKIHDFCVHACTYV